jgi:hypothetical protein
MLFQLDAKRSKPLSSLRRCQLHAAKRDAVDTIPAEL